MRHLRHRRRRVHRLQLRAPLCWRTTDDAVDDLRRAHLRRQSRQRRRPRRRPALPLRPRRHQRPGRRRSRTFPGTTPSSTSPPSRTSTARSRTATRSCAPTASAPTCCATSPGRPASSASCTSPPTRCTAPIDSGSFTESDRPRATLAVLGGQGRQRPDRSLLPHHVRAAGARHRSSNKFGPYQFPEKVIPLFVTNLLDGAKVPLYGDGMNVRDWIYVDDNVPGDRPRPAIAARSARSTTSAPATS